VPLERLAPPEDAVLPARAAPPVGRPAEHAAFLDAALAVRVAFLDAVLAVHVASPAAVPAVRAAYPVSVPAVCLAFAHAASRQGERPHPAEQALLA